MAIPAADGVPGCSYAADEVPCPAESALDAAAGLALSAVLQAPAGTGGFGAAQGESAAIDPGEPGKPPAGAAVCGPGLSLLSD